MEKNFGEHSREDEGQQEVPQKNTYEPIRLSKGEAENLEPTENIEGLQEIADRANKASSPKVKERAEVFIERARQGANIDHIKRIEGDFQQIAVEVESNTSQFYPDWTKKEIEELYYVLYGKEM